MKEFKYKVGYQFKDQAEVTELLEALSKLGYTNKWPNPVRNEKYLITQFGSTNDTCGINQQLSRAELITNKDLFLALAAMVEGDEFHVGEYVVRTGPTWCSTANPNCPNRLTKGILGVITNIAVSDGGTTGLEVNYLDELYGESPTGCRKATKEEITEYVLGKSPVAESSEFDLDALIHEVEVFLEFLRSAKC